MNIKKAIHVSKEAGEWSIVDHMPTSVDVDFINSDGQEDQTQFDLYSDRKEEELDSLFRDFCMENGFPEDTVIGLYVYGEIV